MADEASEFGRFLTGEPLEWGRQANENPPRLRTHDRFGNRIDEVEFHPSWHALLRTSVEHGLHSLSWRESRAGGHVARATLFYLMAQVEAGHGCPISMTHAAVPALRAQRELTLEWEPLLTSFVYDPGLKPAAEKRGALCGMAMTERQGGSDVRANVTTARALGDGEYELTGHKWFCSAPMCDAFLVLAQADGGLSCFLVPRVLPDGTRNAFLIQRLKDKLGDRSNASSEIELDAAWARLVGEEGRGVPTIIQMVNHTRLDCVVGTAAAMRVAVEQATHHAAHRSAFGKLLVDQPLMRNVLADLCVESEAATLTAVRLARAYDRGEDAFARVATAVAKYWVCKRGPGHAAEALECLGGNGYVEESVLPRALPAAAAAVDLGRLGQRHLPRRAARATPQSRDRSMLSWTSAARPQAPSRGSTRGCRCSSASCAIRRTSLRPAPAGSSSGWPSRSRRPCSCVTATRLLPTRSAPRGWPATEGSRTGRSRRASTPPRSSSATGLTSWRNASLPPRPEKGAAAVAWFTASAVPDASPAPGRSASRRGLPHRSATGSTAGTRPAARPSRTHRRGTPAAAAPTDRR